MFDRYNQLKGCYLASLSTLIQKVDFTTVFNRFQKWLWNLQFSQLFSEKQFCMIFFFSILHDGF